MSARCVERDSTLYLRGSPGTLGGRKGSGPLGRSYILLNSELDKNVYDSGLWKLKLGPFLDTGIAYDSSGYFGSKMWLWDVGLQSKIVILRGLTLVLSYGRDLRTGRGCFYSGIPLFSR